MVTVADHTFYLALLSHLPVSILVLSESSQSPPYSTSSLFKPYYGVFQLGPESLPHVPRCCFPAVEG